MKLLTLLHHRFDLWTAPEWFSERLRREFPDIDVEQFEDYQTAEPHLSTADVIVTWSLRPEQVRAAKKLRWIHSPAAAVHQLMIPEIVNSDIVLTNASSVHGAVVAEHVIAVLLALAKRLPSVIRYQQQHLWSQQQLWNDSPRPREVAGATLGIVGLGSIGAETARRALALGIRVIAVREHPERPLPQELESGNVTVYGAVDIGRMLEQSDYVVLAAPLRESTTALMNAERLGAMKKDAYLINVARGPLVDESALMRALQQRAIAGAALDVFEYEPLPPESPLWDMPNVLITPHSAALTEKLWERHFVLLTRNLRRFLSGQSLLSMVDKHKGY
jgi:phosphoglycerate dehydrogenase-like enzyme